MSATRLCLQCGEGPAIIFGTPVAPSHCYGTGDRIQPGLLGGFICSCPCRAWPKPDEPRFRYSEDERWIREGADALLQTKDFANRPVLALATARLLWQLWWRPENVVKRFWELKEHQLDEPPVTDNHALSAEQE